MTPGERAVDAPLKNNPRGGKNQPLGDRISQQGNYKKLFTQGES
jgi:hypothetical protein